MMPKKSNTNTLLLYLLDQLAQQSARITELERRLDEIDAVWPQIAGENNGAS